MCGGLADWQSDGGDSVWFLPPSEEVMESGYCMELGISCGRGSIGDGVGDGVKAVDNGVGWCDSWDDEVVMRKSTVPEMQRDLVLALMMRWQR
jgi:hypothetical protein